MKFAKSILLLWITIILSCKTEPRKEYLDFNLEKENLEILKKIDTINHNNKENLPELEFILKKKNPFDSRGKFILHLPDTVKLNKHWENRQWSENIAYLYLRNYYTKSTKKDSLKYIEQEATNDKSICSFKQEFDSIIKYYTWDCKEAGIEENIEFPKIENADMKKFIELLFYDKWNTWISEFKYEPNGAGCYYEIKQERHKTILSIWCGC